ncbi:RDD family protein [Streptomyces sp. ISL-66]|uniref:RDD family protein n=1 Tax=Streptomyces sp. ISL-66 TaxID=2819186 RepID=UPI001BE7F22C|nr:RDD family protein [Streptomyces sp. ISL-66]MBT2469704.1 RDD family protein [Streptomyces sp. ISL-66]
MSTDQPPPGQPPEDDPFLKKPQEPTPPSSGSPYGSPPADGTGGFPPPPPPGGGGYPPPPPPYGGGGDPYGGGGGGYGMPDPLAGMPPLADFGKRLVARIIDLLIIAIPLFLIQLAFGTKRYTVDSDNGEDVSEVITKSYSGSGLIMTLVSIAAYVGYDWWFTKKNGQTFGKKWMGLRVAMLNDGSVPQSGAALARAAVLWLPTLICCFCLWPIALIVSMLVDKPYKQGLHDKVAKTVVVRAG